MAFKMKGSAFKLGNVATKSVLKQRRDEIEPFESPSIDRNSEPKKQSKPKIDPKTKNPPDKGPLPQKSPMKKLGIYTTDPVTGELIQIPKSDVDAYDEIITTGADMMERNREDSKEYQKEKGEPMYTEEELKKMDRESRKRLVKGYKTKKSKSRLGAGAETKAVNLDRIIQEKINRGEELTPRELEMQRRMLMDLDN